MMKIMGVMIFQIPIPPILPLIPILLPSALPATSWRVAGPWP